MTVSQHRSFCRTCHNFCAVVVDVEDGAVRKVSGDHGDPVYHGYTCTKGRAHAKLYAHPERVLFPLRRGVDGTQRPTDQHTAIEEIAGHLGRIIDEHGPRAVAVYQGTFGYVDNAANWTMLDAFMRAIGSPMVYSTASIDQAGKAVAAAMHGNWMAGSHGPNDPDVLLLLGMNPLTSHSLLQSNPGDAFKDLSSRNAFLIVIDPRRTEAARRATLHLQPRPGTDAHILAGMLRVILDEGWSDDAFLAENVTGVDELRATLEPFTAEVVEQVAGIFRHDLIEAARLFSHAQRGLAAGGTGADMSGHATLVEYLILCLNTVCGHWLPAGETIRNALTLVPAYAQMATAQALPAYPGYGYGEPGRIRGLGETGNGMPTATLAEEILLEGPGQIRALLSLGGNPVVAWPDQQKTMAAMDSLELLVQTDVLPSATAKIADYVIAMKLPYEQPGTTFAADILSLISPVYGLRNSYVQYSSTLVESPPDVLDHPTFIFKLAQAMGLELEVYPGFGSGLRGGTPTSLDMNADLNMQELFEIVHRGSRIPFAQIRAHSGGALYSDPPVIAAPKEEGWQGWLDVANTDMMADLVVAATPQSGDPEFPFRLLNRRMPHAYNSIKLAWPVSRPNHNPAYVHPDDLERLGIPTGAVVGIRSRHGAVTAVVEADDTMRPGTVALSHCWGDAPKATEAVIPGVSPNPLIDNAGIYDQYTGQPQMSNIPIAISAVEAKT